MRQPRVFMVNSLLLGNDVANSGVTGKSVVGPFTHTIDVIIYYRSMQA
jgi:hypothetical protein